MKYKLSHIPQGALKLICKYFLFKTGAHENVNTL